MSRTIALLIVAVLVTAGGRAYAQETQSGPGKVEVTLIPGGGTFFLSKNGTDSFRNYEIGGAGAYNFTRILGIEGEIGGSIGVSQTLRSGGVLSDVKSPNMLTYAGNVIANVPAGHVVPYATAGIGSLTMYSKPELNLPTSERHFTGNIGGGVKWYASNGRWGLRGDYRFIGVRTGSTGSEFFGVDTTRYANRIYGAVLINAVK